MRDIKYNIDDRVLFKHDDRLAAGTVYSRCIMSYGPAYHINELNCGGGSCAEMFVYEGEIIRKLN